MNLKLKTDIHRRLESHSHMLQNIQSEEPTDDDTRKKNLRHLMVQQLV